MDGRHVSRQHAAHARGTRLKGNLRARSNVMMSMSSVVHALAKARSEPGCTASKSYVRVTSAAAAKRAHCVASSTSTVSRVCCTSVAPPAVSRAASCDFGAPAGTAVRSAAGSRGCSRQRCERGELVLVQARC